MGKKIANGDGFDCENVNVISDESEMELVFCLLSVSVYRAD